MASSPLRSVDVVVVGGGIVGLATAYRLAKTRSDARIIVLEKEGAVGQHQSSHNSGVLHAGLYYAPDSRKAELCRRGKASVEAFAEAHGIPVVRNGKLVVAVDERELPALAALTERAQANGVPELRTLDRDELREIEPHVAGVRALHSPTTGVIDFGLVCDALASEPRRLHGTMRSSISSRRMATSGVTTTKSEIEARAVVVCAGLWSSQLAKRAGVVTDVQIVPFRGTWLALRPAGAALVRGNIYPVPDPELPFLGVHFTRRVDGSVWSGPNAVLSLAERAVVRDALRFRGLWRLGVREARVAVREFRLSHWHRACAARAQPLRPRVATRRHRLDEPALGRSGAGGAAGRLARRRLRDRRPGPDRVGVERTVARGHRLARDRRGARRRSVDPLVA